MTQAKAIKTTLFFLQELEENGFYKNEIKVEKAYGKKCAFYIYINNKKMSVADKDVYFVDETDKVVFINRVENKVIEKMSELTKYILLSYIIRNGKISKLAEFFKADETALKSFRNHIFEKESAYDIEIQSKKDGVELNGNNFIFLFFANFIYIYLTKTNKKNI